MSKKNRNRQLTKNKQRSMGVYNAPKILNTGFSETSASTTRSSLAGWNPVASSPDSDIIANLPTLRARSRNLRQGGAPLASAAVNVERLNVVGSGLSLSAKPDKSILGLKDEEAKEWGRKTQKEFDLWASSVKCDFLRINNFYDMQDIVFTGYLDNGDGWAVFKYAMPTPDMPYSLRLHVFEADRVRNPNNPSSLFGSPTLVYDINSKNKNRIIDGVEIDKNGTIVAYWVANTYSYDPTNFYKETKFIRVEAFGKQTGLPNILQIKHDERAEQFRGTPFLAPIIESLKQIGRYTQAELTAAIVKAYLTIFIRQDLGADGFGTGLEQSFEERERIDPRKLQVGPGTINTLPPGYSVSTVDGSRSMSAFEPFMSELTKGIGASLNIPYEILTKHFSSSYSASRAALLQSWQEFRTRRSWFIRDFCQNVYERWLVEAIAIGRIDAPGFFEDPLIRAAWSKCSWYGPVPGQVDPEKEVRAAALRVSYGFSTNEEETRGMGGGDWQDNIEIIAQEQKLLKDKELVTRAIPQTLENTAEGGDNIEDLDS
ncbi:phage portal protein [Selenomonadales bacterium OttesenSCG-928-I06]|nr:phage portal protein [Selenomonadales bacterium OttesenSCG-928-I06]